MLYYYSTIEKDIISVVSAGARGVQKVQSHRASHFWIGSWDSRFYFVVYSDPEPRDYNLHRASQIIAPALSVVLRALNN
jgi:hypothetical protein